MSTTALKVELPVNVSEDEARLLLAVKTYEVGTASLGQASRIAGLSKRAFMELLGRYGVAVFNYAPDDLRGEVES